MSDTQKKPGTGPSGGKRGRPVIHEMPERIDASPEEIAETVLRAKPRSEWRYEREAKREQPESN